MRRPLLSLPLAAATAAALGYDAYVHLHLAPLYDAVGGAVTQGLLFRVEAALAVAAALLVLVSDSRLAWAAAGLVGLGGVAAVVLYRYVDVGAIGPIPNMYEPAWYGEKTWSAVAEAAVGLLWPLRELVRLLSRPAARSSKVAGSKAG
jgi:hypothetical protein